MKNVVRSSISLAFIKVGFVKFQVYKQATIVKLIASIIFLIVQYSLWHSIFKTNSIHNYEFSQMFTYIIIGQMLTNIYPNNVSSEIGRLIRSGDIGATLLKPVTIMKQLLFESIGTSLFRFLFVSMPVGIGAMLLTGIQLSSQRLLEFIIISSFSYIFCFLFELIIGIMSFYTTSQWGIQSFKYAIITLLSGKFLPLSLYPAWAKKILDLLPFKLLYSTPIENLLNGEYRGFQFIILYQLVVVILLYLIFKLLFSEAIKKLVIQGG